MAMATAAGLSMPDAWVTRGDEAGTLNNLGLALSPRERLTGTFLPLVTPRRSGKWLYARSPGGRRETGSRDHKAGEVKRTANAATRSASFIAVRLVLAGLGAENTTSRLAARSAASCVAVRLVLAGLGADNTTGRLAAWPTVLVTSVARSACGVTYCFGLRSRHR